MDTTSEAANPVLPTETLLDDEYPVFGDYLYVVDGRVERSDVFGTVRDLRRALIRRGKSADEVRRCDIVARHSRQREGA